jgi:ribosomal protein L11 methyltransferase
MGHALLQLDLPSEHAELASDALFECGAGGVEEQGTRRKARLIVYAATALELEPLRAALPAALEARGIPAATYRLTVREELASDWERAYLQHLRAVEVAPGYWLRPTHDTTELPTNARVLLFEAEVAFGDGAHRTTHLAARAVSERVSSQPGCNVFDFGTGNGVLALLALLAGAARAVGVDIDPRSVTAARRNAELNRCQARASFQLPDETPDETFDYVIANVEEPALLGSSSSIARRVPFGPKGTALLGVTGFLLERAPIVIAAFAEHELVPLRTLSDEDWAFVEFTRG